MNLQRISDPIRLWDHIGKAGVLGAGKTAVASSFYMG